MYFIHTSPFAPPDGAEVEVYILRTPAVPCAVDVTVLTVPKVVILAEHDQVETAVFSTLFKDKSVLTSAELRPSTPLEVNLA